jgi:hypothetical protein
LDGEIVMVLERKLVNRAIVGVALLAVGLLASTGIAVAADAPQPKVADACSLLKPGDVTAALRTAPKALRPLHVDAGVPTSPTTAASTTQACALGLLLRKNVGGSIQVLTSAARKGLCPPVRAKASDITKVAGKPVVLVRFGKSHSVGGVVFAKHGTCVSLAAVLSNGRSSPTDVYRALARNALDRL